MCWSAHCVCGLQKTDKHLPIMAEMLGIDQEQIRNWLCKRKIVTANEVLTKPLNISQVITLIIGTQHFSGNHITVERL